MLEHLHVKNLALIREAEIDFTEGLNILTGETGAGKSIVIGSVGLALGGKVAKDLVRPGADFGLAELVFSVTNERLKDRLKELDVIPEDGQIILSRKIMNGKSINKINGETVTPVSYTHLLFHSDAEAGRSGREGGGHYGGHAGRNRSQAL